MLSRFGLSTINQLRQPSILRSLIAVPARSSATDTSSSGKIHSKLAVTATPASRTLGSSAAVERKPWDGPDRDLVNFPRPVQAEEGGKVRYLFIPEEWFEMFYKKTGVTGPYMLGFGVWTYVMSKEIWLIDHEYYYVYAMIGIIYILNRNFGKGLGDYLNNEIEAEVQEYKDQRAGEISGFKKGIEDEKTLQWQKEADKLIIEAKRENVALQQEAIYRERAMLAFNEIKRRLEYQAQKQLMERRVSQKHMVEWIVSNALKAITPQQEAETLKKCLVDLQSLSARA